MKTTFTKTIATLGIVTALFTQTVNAKEATIAETIKNYFDVNVLTQIDNTIKTTLAEIKAPVTKQTVTKQVNHESIKLKTDMLVKNIDNKIPGFKFKVVIAD